MFNISVQSYSSIPCIVPEGRLDTINSIPFNEQLNALAGNESYLIIDLAKCNYLASSGIRALMSAHKRLALHGGYFILTGLRPEVFQVIEMTGLQHVFPICSNNSEAGDKILGSKKASSISSEFVTGIHRYEYEQTGKNSHPALIWMNQGIAGYDELIIAAGSGSAAESPVEEHHNRGVFITAGNFAGFIPFNEQVPPDFRVTGKPSAAGIYLQWAVSFNNNPEFLVRLKGTIPLKELVADLKGLPPDSREGELKGLIVADYNTGIYSLSLIVVIDPEKSNDRMYDIPSELRAALVSDETGVIFLGMTIILNSLPSLQTGDSLPDFINKTLTIDNIEEIRALNLPAEQVNPVVWLFQSGGMEDATDHRIKIEVEEGLLFENYKYFLTRRLYTDSRRVVVKPLHGGYSAQTFQVESFDHAGRKLRPTVMKMASRALITREAERCKKYALPFIMNNAAMVLGTEFFGDTGALRYNFVGIGGEETRLKWLTHYFNTWPAEKLEPMFDKIFLQILKPWYGQPVKENIRPFLDHDPTLTFFDKLFEIAETVLGISADDPEMILEETGEKRMNPYWFLKHVYTRRREDTIPYFTSVCHGDLNMQNILLDESMNVYLIDFSETKPRSAVSDFARLEAIFMVEQAPMENAEDFRKMIAFTSQFYGKDSPDRQTATKWEGLNNEIMDRNLALILKMREYAIGCTSGDTNILPYYFSMLEWVFPVVCYSGLPIWHKKLSAYVAAMLCEKIAT